MAGQYTIEDHPIDASGTLQLLSDGIYVIPTSAGITMEGLTYPPQGSGLEIVIYNDGAHDVTIAHANANADPHDRIYLTSGADHTLTPGAELYGWSHPTSKGGGWRIDNGGQ